ncbi:hypothetical protein HPB48_018350 [Haemaphysalis longicornis]|uniref:Uncharacterized protein n=1 Tax=Haemaphysalis longicornis TaxID=44386 RepID=A0A9J6GWS8_HAELO|nr:hypothetical protein HPB48_018350 [Haemaphysalis longicornis]
MWYAIEDEYAKVAAAMCQIVVLTPRPLPDEERRGASIVRSDSRATTPAGDGTAPGARTGESRSSSKSKTKRIIAEKHVGAPLGLTSLLPAAISLIPTQWREKKCKQCSEAYRTDQSASGSCRGVR